MLTGLFHGWQPLASINIGERHRKDLGDIDALAASMDELGLLQEGGAP